MFPEDPDPIGDMQCLFSVKSSIPFLVESKKFPVNFSEHIYFTEEAVGDYINIPSSLKEDFEYNIFLKRMKVSEMGSQTVFKISSDEYPEMVIFRDLVKIPSVAIDYKFIEGGYHKTILTFHHTHLTDVSRFMFKARKTLGNGIPEYLGPNRGFNFVLEKALKAERVVACIISMKAPVSESKEMNHIFSSKWTRRLRYSNSNLNNDFLYRINTAVTSDNNIFEVISRKDGIYRATTASEVSLFYSKLLFEHYNPMFYQYHEYDGNTLRICGAVSQSYERTLLNVVSDSAKRFPKLGIKLSYVAPVIPGNSAIRPTPGNEKMLMAINP